MTSQWVERTWIRMGGYGRFRGEWVNTIVHPILIMDYHYPSMLRPISILHLCNVTWTAVLKGKYV